MIRWQGRVALALLAALPACKSAPEEAVCGLHSAAAPLKLERGGRELPLYVGGRVFPSDRLTATGPALLECFGGAWKLLEKRDSVKVSALPESQLIGSGWPRGRWRQGKVQALESLPRTVAARYTDVQATTPESATWAQTSAGSADYLKAFFTPNGIEAMGNEKPPEGPRALPPPPLRDKVAVVHGADPAAQVPGELSVEVTDGAIFVEADDLATAALLEDHTYAIGRAVRLLLPRGAEATLHGPSRLETELEGPLDLSLR